MMSEWHRRETMQASRALQDALTEVARLKDALRRIRDVDYYKEWETARYIASKALEGAE